MDAARWHALDTLFHEALALPVAERAAYLSREALDPALRAEVEAMLEAAVPERALAVERLVADSPAPDPMVGIRLGPWRTLDVLGHGGMGTVYLAERADGQYEQQVALKIVPRAMTPVASARFAIERHALARLAHPNIAHLIDAGTTPEGSPYLVLEYVDGQPLTAHADESHLTVEERLRLFRVVCDATQHAHKALVVHRDLKPSNIFVSRDGQVKLLDFGIAKLLDPDDLTEATDHGLRVLTPAYAAPEQLDGRTVTTATDVYVLGAVLYELLTGVRPAPEAPGHRIPPPSLAVRGLGQDAGHVALGRRTTPGRLARRLAGDIDRIVLKALAPEPERRYESAGHFGDDIGRCLDGHPVHARPDAFGYRAGRFLTRHAWSVAVGVAALVGLSAFGVVSARQASVIAEERDRARRQADRAERVSRLLGDLFTLAGPRSGGGPIESSELLDRGAARIASELIDDPDLQAELFTIVGTVYGDMSLHARGVDVLEHALRLERDAQPTGSLAQATTRHQLGELLVIRNDIPNAERHLRDALNLRRSLGAPRSDVAATLVALGRALGLRNAAGEAVPLLEEAVGIRRSQPGVSAEDLMTAVYELGMAHHRAGALDVGERLFRESVDIGRGIDAPSPGKLAALIGLARLLHQFQRKPVDAEPVYREALAAARATFPADHQDVGTSLGELARVLRDLGRLDEAESVAREGLAMFRRLFGPHHREVAIGTQTLAGILRAARRLDEAEVTQREALASATAALGPAHPLTFAAMRALASILEARGRWPEAFRLRSDELRTAVDALGERDVFVAIALGGLGDHLLAAGRPAEAVPYLERALAVRTALHPAGHARIVDAQAALDGARAKVAASNRRVPR